VERQSGGQRRERYGGAIMLAIAYGANVGGMGTKIGTVPNAALCGFAARELGREISFLEFLGIGLPFVAAFLPVVWLALWREGRADAPGEAAGAQAIERQLAALGPMGRQERWVLGVFLATAGLWVFSTQTHEALKPWIGPPLKAWGLSYLSAHTEAGIALLAAAMLMILPAGGGRHGPLLAPRRLRAIPWGSLVLLGGGFALAHGLEASGLSLWLGDRLELVRSLPALGQYLGVCLVTVAISAIASNVATTNLMLPILLSLAGPQPMGLLAASALASSCDFMLPAGTPPNAIVFGSGYLTIPRMARVGVVLDLLSALLLGLWGYCGVRSVLG
jgi:sodium-dependent dicarboxylate transporter 2/3/5